PEKLMHVTNEAPGAITESEEATHANAPAALAVHGGPEGPGRGLGPAPVAVGAPAPLRQPHPLLRGRRRGRLRGGVAPGAGVALDRPPGAPRHRGRARGRRDLARPRGPGRAADPPRAVHARLHACRAEHAGRRRAAARLRDLSPDPPDLRRPAPELSARPRL